MQLPAYWRVWLGAAGLKVLLFPSYRSTDFNVHRNWLAVTYGRNASHWYADAPRQNSWTLDYPPLFGLYEYGFSKLAARVDVNIVEESLADYASLSCVRFQRGTVILTELASLGGAVWAATNGDTQAALAFAGSGALLLVDHLHFQYNGLLLGHLVYMLAKLRKGDCVAAGVLFALLCCAKHLFLTLTPVLAAVFLAVHVRPRRDKVRAFLELALSALTALAAGLSPLLIPAWRAGRFKEALTELAGRLFPFDARGLVHSYWAPNVWALYVFADRVLLKVLRRSAGAGATRGLVETAVEVLPRPGPKACALLTILAGLPAVYAAARAAPASMRRLTYPCVAHAALAAFAFGWHVHEKFLLVALMPLALLALEGRPRDVVVFRQAARLATFAVLPLIPGCADGVTKLLVVLGEELVLRAAFGGGAFYGEGLHCSFMMSLVALKELWPWVGPARLEFLPLMLTSIYGAGAVVALTAYSARRLLDAARRRDAGDWEAVNAAPSPRPAKPAQWPMLNSLFSALGSRDSE
jgi:alpha-1,3-glucosyltransferase